MVGVIGGLLGIAPIVGINPVIPPILGFGILFICLSIAQFVAFHELRIKQAKNEWEYTRQKKIELAVKQLDGLSDVLQVMRKQLRNTTGTMPLKTVERATLDKVHPYMFEEYPAFYIKEASIPSLEGQLKYFLDLTALADTLGIGLVEVRGDDSWLALERKLEAYPKADTLLRESIKEFRIILFGAYTYCLFNRYERTNIPTDTSSHSQIHTVIRSVTADQAVDDTVDKALTKVNKRINELLCGG